MRRRERQEDDGAQKSPSAKQAGFSLIELIVSVGILAIIASVSSLAWTGYLHNQAITAGAREFTNIIREAQGNAIGRINGGEWGVHIVNPNDDAPRAVMFIGPNWASGTPDRSTSLSTRVDLLTPPEPPVAPPPAENALDLHFEGRTGKLLNPTAQCGASLVDNCSQVDIVGLVNGDIRTITIWEHGGIELQ